MNRPRLVSLATRLPLILVVLGMAFVLGRVTAGRAVGSAETHGMAPVPHEAHAHAGSRAGADDSGDDGAVPRLTLGRRAMALMEVETGPAVRRPIDHRLRLSGRVDYDETRLNDVAPRVEGQITRLYVNYRNAKVTRGQRLAELYSPTMLAASQELRLLVESGREERLLAPARRKLELLGASKAQIDRIESGEVIDTFTIHSPISGVVVDIAARQGDWVGRGDVMMRITDLSRVWVLLDAYESDLPWLDVGQQVELSVEALAGRVFEGEVAFIDPVVADQSRTARVRVDLPNPDGAIRPGMLARGTVLAPLGVAGTTEPEAAPLLVPTSAPLLTGRRAVVYVRDAGAEAPSFEARDVVLGPRAGDWYVVLAGLDEGEVVVTNGAFKIDSELQIRGRPSMMSAPSEESAPEAHAIVRYDVPDEFSDAIGGVVESYLAVTRALAADDPAGASAGIPRVRGALAAASCCGLPDLAAEAWRALRAELLEALETMSAVPVDQLAPEEALARLRVPLHPLSIGMERAVHLFGAGERGPLYRAYCPMAFDDAGASWLQSEARISNPYFGASMLRCGTSRPIGSARDASHASAEEEGRAETAPVAGCH